ncbi:hypothetical protein LshimejAT787_1205410 [Lyophyllum shimeji]|uniref:Uncharacterized protein n=1 Tax=Lyophyllum shimeji TaxID=47721 RepID=A0A9P3USC4_LYOSH|nr:hypothetical protein LshimejAT787_1205410 [Lyophyllum shimeji]
MRLTRHREPYPVSTATAAIPHGIQAETAPQIPVELWRLVFRFATISPKTARLYDADFYPFWDSWLDNQSLDDTLDVKKAIVSIKRIDWCTFGNERFYGQHCTILSCILLAAPKLLYLSLRYKLDPFPGPPYFVLPSLATLRLEGEIGLYGLSMPGLKHLICDQIQAAADCLLQNLPKLRTLQLCGISQGFQFDVFRLSPHLTEFCCSVHRETTIVLGCLHPMLQTVHLYCASDFDRRTITGFEKKSVMLYNCTTFPALERIVLHGEGWNTFIQHSEFALFRLRIFDRGCRIEYPNGERIA